MVNSPAPRACPGRVVCRLAVIVMLLIPEVAQVGQLHIKKIELNELIRRSTHVVIAEPDNPHTAEEQVVIKARGKKPPPYVRLLQRYRVRESLRGDLAPGTVIAVAPADDVLQERLHRDYHLKGLSRHVAVDRYERQGATDDSAAQILFLRQVDTRFAYSVTGGAEGLALHREVERLLGANPVNHATPRAEPESAHRHSTVTLRDVQGLNGGQNVYVWPDRRVLVQRATAVEAGLHERRFEFVLSERQSHELQQLLAQHPLEKVRIPMHPGMPDQARPEITLVAHDGTTTTVAMWDDDRQPDFDALYDHLLSIARQTETMKPVWEGDYASEWKPE